MPTVSRIRILGSTLFITALTLYDAEGRVLQVKTPIPHALITDIASTQYGFSGWPVRVYRQQWVQASGLPKNEMGGAQTLSHRHPPLVNLIAFCIAPFLLAIMACFHTV